MDNDNRVAAANGRGTDELFGRLDATRDGYMTMQEYTQGGGFSLDARGGPSFRFSNIDMNRDGSVTRSEWNLGSADFTRLDLNRDNRLSRFEFENDTAAYHDYQLRCRAVQRVRRQPGRMDDATRIADGARMYSIGSTRTGTTASAASNSRTPRASSGRDGSDPRAPRTARSAAWRTGHDRGSQEGRAAGREDSLAGKDGISKDSASSWGPTRDTRLRSGR